MSQWSCSITYVTPLRGTAGNASNLCQARSPVFCQTQFDHIKAVFWNIYPIHRVGLSEMFLLIVIAVLFPSSPFCWIGSRCFALSIDSWATSYCDVDMATMSLWGQALPPGVRFHPAPQKDIYCIHLPTPGIRHAPFWGEIPSSANHKSLFLQGTCSTISQSSCKSVCYYVIVKKNSSKQVLLLSCPWSNSCLPLMFVYLVSEELCLNHTMHEPE